ncbi:MAG: thiol-disulfide isomerase [Acidobacteriia bacterium]|nr:thiol-disulfide isomerase [Terriglobia bacterium]
MFLRPVLVGACAAVLSYAASAPSQTTFTKDVLPIMQKRCQTCHRPGEVAPMSFLTYSEVRPWAKAIREAVLTRKMPPWFADPHYGKFENDRSLAKDEIDTVVSWVDGGAREGDSKDAPKPVAWVDGWSIGKPDQVFEMPHDFDVPAAGTIEYQYIVIPSGFTKDTWVQAAEARPGNRKLVHHIIAFVRPPGSKWLSEAKPGVPFVPPAKKDDEKKKKNNDEEQDDSAATPELLIGFAPGLVPMTLPSTQAKLVKAGSDFVFQMHYTATGNAGTDRSRIGVIYAKEAPKERVFTSNATNSKFVIPPGDPAFKVVSSITLQQSARLVDLMPHMHYRGKDFEYRAVYPTGETQVLLSVPKYDFNWQLFYYLSEPITLPKGTRIDCTAHFDNSPNNRYNPDPKAEVRWGDQTWEEMMIGWFDVAVDANSDPVDVFREKKESTKAGL